MAAGIASGGLSLGEFGECGSGNGGEIAERRLSFLRAAEKFLRDSLSDCVLAAVGQRAAHLLQGDIHVGSGSIVQFGHASSVGLLRVAEASSR